MTLQDILPLITGGAGGFAALIIGMWLLGTGRFIPREVHRQIVGDKDKQISDLSQAVSRERQRADAGVLAAQAARDVLQALHSERVR